MGQSLVKNYVHIIFSTKYRQRLIHPPVEEELYAYMGGICNAMGCSVIKVGGYQNHVHILCLMSRKIPMMELLKELKARSSKWVKSKGAGYENFFWQDGYAAFSVNPRGVERVRAYIANQHAHHRRKEFEKEFLGFLKKYQVEYDERYVWD